MQLGRLGLDVGTSSLEVLRNKHTDPTTITLADGRAFREVATLRCLGVLLSHDGHTLVSATHRRGLAWDALRRYRSLLASRFLSEQRRLRLGFETIGQTLLHGSGGWKPTVGVAELCHGIDSVIARAVWNRPRQDGETFPTFRKRAAAWWRQACGKFLVQPCFSGFLSRHLNWAGHAAVMPETSINRIAATQNHRDNKRGRPSPHWGA